MQQPRISLLVIFVALLLTPLGCSHGLGPEPVFEGTSLTEWGILAEEEGPDGPSPAAQKAIKAVRSIGPEKAIPFLVRDMQPPWENSTIPGGARAGGALECFKIFGPEAKTAIPGLAKILSRPAKTMNDSSAQEMAAEALSYLGAEAVPALLAAATNFQGTHIQWIIIDHMENFGTNGAAAEPALLKWSQDSDGWVRLGALHAYAAIETNKAVTTQFLLKALKDSNELVRRDAAEYLGSMAQGEKSALPALLAALEDPDWQVQSGAVTGLGKLGTDKAIVLPLLVQKLHDQNRIIRRCAAFALGDVGGKEAFDELLKATDDPDGFVREAVFYSLKQIDPKALEQSGQKF